jgi:uncharacterized protein YceK
MRRVVVLMAVLALAVSGCAGVSTGKRLNGMKLTEDNADPVAHVNAESWGIYFLPIFPLITGDTSSTAGGMAFLADSCKVEPVVDMSTRAAKEMGAARLTDLTSSVTSVWIPPLFWYKSVQVSGNAVE